MATEKRLPHDYYEKAKKQRVRQGFRGKALGFLAGATTLYNGQLQMRVPRSLVDLEGPAVFGLPHRSSEDIIRTAQALHILGRDDVRFVYKSEYHFWGLSPFFHPLGGIAVERGFRDRDPEFHGTMLHHVNNGDSAVYYVESTRVREDTRKLHKAKAGGAMLATQAGVPYVPSAFAGLAVDDELPTFFDRKPILYVAHDPIEPILDVSIPFERRVGMLKREHARETQQCLDEAYALWDAA